jgi:predicted nucleotidyltransferase component of viral defense system
MALEENMAEKIARLTRRTPARDVYDLVWIATTSPHSGFRRDVVRRLAVLKNWVDQYGASSPPTEWQPVTGAARYDSARWRTTRRAADFDEDSIGLLTVPAPNLDDLGAQLHQLFEFLAELDELEQRIISGGASSRRLVLDALSNLPGSRLAGRQVY